MIAPLRHGKNQYYVVANGIENPPNGATRVQLNEYASAFFFLSRVAANTDGVTLLRTVLAKQQLITKAFQYTDKQVLDVVAKRVHAGDLRIFEQLDARYRWHYADKDELPEEEKTPEIQPFERPQPAPKPVVPAEFAESQATPLINAAKAGVPFCEECAKAAEQALAKSQPAPEEFPNAEAQAQTLVQASEQGVPFCEECAKAAAERQKQAEAPPAPEEFPNAQAQAETLKEAAEEGTPFCEECEKAKKQLAAQQSQGTTPTSQPNEPTPAPPEEVTEPEQPESSEDFPAAEAQAATMKQAAEEGTPFCEECEKARKAQESQATPTTSAQ